MTHRTSSLDRVAMITFLVVLVISSFTTHLLILIGYGTEVLEPPPLLLVDALFWGLASLLSWVPNGPIPKGDPYRVPGTILINGLAVWTWAALADMVTASSLLWGTHTIIWGMMLLYLLWWGGVHRFRFEGETPTA